MKIIGLSGTNGSGKDTVADILGKDHGFYIASAYEMLTNELKKLGQSLDRKNTRELSAKWRRESGLGVIVKKAIEEAKNTGSDKLIVGSLRNPGEADLVHELNGVVIWVDADPKLRYERITSGNRNRASDKKSYEEFLEDEKAEMTNDGKDTTTLNMAAVKDKSDIFIQNNGTLEELHEKILSGLKGHIS